MKSNILLAAFAVLLAAGPGAAQEHEKHGRIPGEAVTLKGEIVDLACYINHQGRGKKHKKCALEGAPIGLLTGGTLFVLLENHEKAQAYAAAKKLAGDTVRAAGRLSNKGGLQALVVENVEKAKDSGR